MLKLYGFDWDAEWQDGETRESVMVFIADELPEEEIRTGFEALSCEESEVSDWLMPHYGQPFQGLCCARLLTE